VDATRAAGNEIIEISAAEKARWQQAVQPVYDAWIGEMNRRGRNGRAMFNDLLAITGQPPRA
jgi:TRAP-type C4-dicarboxylate transport system substrate-binding protein